MHPEHLFMARGRGVSTVNDYHELLTFSDE